jgi:hypothetical protein
MKYVVPIAASATVLAAGAAAMCAFLYGDWHWHNQATPEGRAAIEAQKRKDLLQTGAVVAGLTAAGVALGGARPGTVGRGILWGAVTITALIIVNETVPLPDSMK